MVCLIVALAYVLVSMAVEVQNGRVNDPVIGLGAAGSEDDVSGAGGVDHLRHLSARRVHDDLRGLAGEIPVEVGYRLQNEA
jgi:hypothetical protein